jgi:FtsP/CotA-like multicopper oxidase with cupredoxin domain
VHWHGFPNQIPYFDGVPNGSLAVPIGANLVYRFLPYRGMAGSYMWHCHVSDAEHVQMGLQSIVYIRPYQNYGGKYGTGITPVVDPSIPVTRAGWLALRDAGASSSVIGTSPPTGPGTYLGYVFNDGVVPTDPNSTAYHREFALILDDIDTRIHWDDSHFAQQDFSGWAPRFFVMNGRAWPDTIQGNWDVRVLDPASGYVYNTATGDQVLDDPYTIYGSSYDKTVPFSDTSTWHNAKLKDQVYTTSDLRLGAQPWSSLIQANAGETIVLRFSNLSYDQFSMQLGGLPFKVIGKDAKSLLQGRDSYYETPNPADSSFTNFTKRDDISYMAYQVDINVAESRELLVKIPADAFNSDGTPVIFDFFDRNYTTSSAATPGGPVAGGMRTQLHVYPPAGHPHSLPDQWYPNQVFQA